MKQPNAVGRGSLVVSGVGLLALAAWGGHLVVPVDATDLAHAGPATRGVGVLTGVLCLRDAYTGGRTEVVT